MDIQTLRFMDEGGYVVDKRSRVRWHIRWPASMPSWRRYEVMINLYDRIAA